EDMRRRTDTGAPFEQRSGPSTDASWRAAAARRFAISAGVCITGIVVIAATTGTARIIGWGIEAIGLVLAISFVFLEVGYSEDRARAAEQRSSRRIGRIAQRSGFRTSGARRRVANRP